MAKTMLKCFLNSIFFGINLEKNLDSELYSLCSFLESRIKNSIVSESELENLLAIACEKVFTDNSIVIILRAMYFILLEKYYKNISQERSEVLNLGGLHVIGTERHESRRIDNQLRGRSGRQGDPGSSRFFLSLEDNLLRIFGGDRIVKLMDSLKVDDDIPIESSLLNKSLESAQKKVEVYYYDARKQLFDYDEVLNYQRQAIYSERRRILESNNLRDWVLQYAETTILDYLNAYLEKNDFSTIEKNKLLTKVESLLGLPYTIDREVFLKFSIEEMKEALFKQIRLSYDLKESQIDLVESGLMRELERSFLLQKIDSAWKEHLQQINTLRENIGWRGYGQKDPLIEYKNEAYNLFVNMSTNIRHSVVYLIFRSQPILKV
jgi:preprotein translocase subunit SecA